MWTTRFYSIEFIRSLTLALLIAMFFGCENTNNSKATVAEEKENTIPAEEVSMPSSGNVVEIVTEQMDFQLPDQIPSGWTTFRYNNQSGMTHFVLFDKMPMHEGKQMNLENMEKEVMPVFQNAMDKINEGNAEAGFKEFENLPAWFSKLVFTGGVGMSGPGKITQATVNMEPGTYVVECYVKSDGKIHSAYGMAKELIVTEEKAEGKAPSPDITIKMSEEGMTIDGKPKTGYQTVVVDYQTQKPHENFVGHDVNLVKLESDTDIEELQKWINWANPEGLVTPAPAEFLGGIQELPAGKKGYFTVNFTPGKYAWISEVPNALDKNLLKIFVVPEEDKRLSEN